MPDLDPRRLLLELFQAALSAVDSRRTTREALKDFTATAPIAVIAIGKAAPGMARGAVDALSNNIDRGLIITTEDADTTGFDHRFECLAGGHPLPTQSSLNAGNKLLAFLNDRPPHAHLLFLISGGTSALVEAPAPGVTLDDLTRLNQWLLASGLDITAVNTIRKCASRIKGGGLLHYLEGRQTTALYVSDVPGDRVEDIGSGLLGPVKDRPLPPLPDWIMDLLTNDEQPQPQPQNDSNITRHVIAKLSDAMQAAATAAREQGLDVFIHEQRLEGEAENAGRKIVEELLNAPPGIHIWGGETTVTLPPNPGRGGRCQTLALAAAVRLAQSPPSSPPLPQGEGWGEGIKPDQPHHQIILLSASTDGIDGPTEDAGAVVDATTASRGELASLDAQRALTQADAGTFLEASGDLLYIGPTGTNVADVSIGFKR